MKNFIYACIFFILFSSLYSQKESYIWYFGANAGLDFNTPDLSPKVLTNGALNNWEGCASICDTDGKLLFYTNGMTVWNRRHTIMENGSGLAGFHSSTQSGLIVRKPGSMTDYFVFTTGAVESSTTDGLYYSIVTFNTTKPDGYVSTKNFPINGFNIERITAVLHQNKKDIWIICYDWRYNNYVTYLLNENGIDISNAVISPGAVYNNQRSGHYLRTSPSGKMIASAHQKAETYELYNFDNLTGKLTLRNLIKGLSRWPYGVEFSPNEKYLYASTFEPCRLYQFDISMNTDSEIKNSMYELDFKSDAKFYFGALQAGPDGKIYVAKDGDFNLGVINNPNEKGINCNYKRDAIYLSGKKSSLGLPNIFVSYLNPSTFCNALGDELIENGTLDSIKIDVKSDYPIVIDNIISVPGFISFSDDHHVFKLVGCTDNINKIGYEFIVNNHKTNDKAIVIFSKDVIIGEEYILSFDALPFSSIMTNEFIVEINNKKVGSFVFLNPKCNWETFKLSWIADVESANIKIISNNKSSDEIVFALDNFSFKSCSCTPPTFNDFPDTTICFGGKMQIGYPANYEYQYKWLSNQDISDVNVSNPTIFPKNNIQYILQITTKNGCVAYDTVNVEVSPKQNISILGKQTICFGESEILSAGSDMVEYQWSTGEKTKAITINQAGKYILTAKDANGCVYEGEFSVEVQPEIIFSVNGKFVLCNDEIGNLYVVENFKDYLWSNGSKTKEITINSAGTYWVKVTDENGCTATKEVQVNNTGLNILYPDSLDFGKICMYSAGSLASYLKNLNSENIIADTIYFAKETKEFSVIYNDTLPQTVLPNKLLPFTLNFTPKTEKFYHDTLIIVISEPCPTVIKIPIFAEGLKSSAEIFVIDTIVLVNTELCIPISGRMTCALPQTLISEYEIEVLFNKKLFLPQYVLKGEIISNRIEGDKRIVRIRQDSVFLETDTTHLTYLCGIIMLSDSIVNVVDIADFDWKSKLIEYRIYPGKVTVEHCVLPVRQIQLIENYNLMIKPNPSSDFIEVNSIQKDKTYIAEIIDMLGVVISKTEISIKQNKINISNIPIGTYFIRIDGQSIKFVKN